VQFVEADIFAFPLSPEYYGTVRLGNVHAYTGELPDEFMRKVVESIFPGGQLVIEAQNRLPDDHTIKLFTELEGWGYEATENHEGKAAHIFTKPNREGEVLSGEVIKDNHGFSVDRLADLFNEVYQRLSSSMTLSATVGTQSLNTFEYQAFVILGVLPDRRENESLMHVEREKVAAEWEKIYKQMVEADEGGDPASLTTTGGINFDPALLDLQIKRDGNGVPLPLIQQPIENLRINGFLPVIINVSPVSIPFLLGEADSKEHEETNDISYDPIPNHPRFKNRLATREPENLSYLN